MEIKRNIWIIILIIMLMALLLQLAKSDFVIRFFKNINIYQDSNISKLKVPEGFRRDRFLVVFDSAEPNSITIRDNTIKTLEYMKKEAVPAEVSELGDLDKSYTGVILTFESYNKIRELNKLLTFVEEGGALFAAERPLNDGTLSAHSSDFGIKEINGFIDTAGIKLLTDLMIKGTDLRIQSDFLGNSSLAVTLDSNSKVHAVSSDAFPLVWEYTRGKGKIIAFNGTMLNEKVNRGLLAGCISLMSADFIYPIINSKLIYIDDFPAPISDSIDKDIHKEYQRNISQFFRDIWWPDMLQTARKWNIQYTGLIIQTYNDRVIPPFETRDKSNNLLLYGRELLKSGGELGIHGYNHQSLAPEGYIKQELGYKAWAGKEHMKAALMEVNRYAKEVYPHYNFRVYVPPSNILSPEGREALLEAMPDLRILSSLYTGDFHGDSYEQEFEIKDRIIELPRLTAGYDYNEETLWTAYNGINIHGIFSHFIHPDDVLDARRSAGYNWTELNKQFNKLLGEVNGKFAWLRPMTASKGAEEVKKYVEITPYYKYEDNELEGDRIHIFCDGFKDNLFFILRSSKSITTTSNCQVFSIGNGLYLIEAREPEIVLKLHRVSQ